MVELTPPEVKKTLQFQGSYLSGTMAQTWPPLVRKRMSVQKRPLCPKKAERRYSFLCPSDVTEIIFISP
jgi:hypothetical protein